MSEFKSPYHLINAFLRQPVPYTPIWLMRQAGRYLPEYRQLREKCGGFLEMAKNPEIACEITLQPLKRFGLLDGAIIFSDILVIPDAMGLELYFVENEGPKFKKIIKTQKDIEQIIIPEPREKLNYVLNAIKLVKSELNNKKPLIGFSGSPWTIATYMMEDAKKMLYTQPELLKNLLDKLSDSIILYLNAQIEAGVDAVMIFDTWGGLLSTRDYEKYSVLYAQKIIKNLKRENNNKKIPVIFFTKNGGQWLNLIENTACDVIGLDWTVDIAEARKKVGNKMALQGNMDPQMLYTSPEKIRAEVEFILSVYGKHPGHIFNLGHGIPKDVPVENVAALINAVHELSPKYHG